MRVDDRAGELAARLGARRGGDVSPSAAGASENRRMARAAGVVASLTLLSRASGLIRDVVVSYYFGAGLAAEAFFVAFRLPNLFRRLAAEGAMSIAFIPVFTDLLQRESRSAAIRALRALLSLTALLLTAIVVLGVAFAPLWVRGLAPGFADDPKLLGLTVHLTRVLFPYLLLIGLASILAGFLNSIRHFVAPALSPVILNVSIIAVVLVLSGHLANPILGLAYGVLLGGILQLSLQVIAVVANGVTPLPRWQPKHPAGRRALSLLAPTIVGTAVFQINVLTSTVLASLLPAGSVSYLWYADRIFEFPLGVFAVALGTAALPSLASQASRGALDELRRSLSFTIGLINFLSLPAAVGLIVLARPMTALILERGAFDAHDSLMTARALQFYAIGLWAVSLSRILGPGFYALGEPRIPTISAIASVAVSLVLSVALMGPVPATGISWSVDSVAAATRHANLLDLGHGGLALATSLAAVFNTALLAVLLARRVGGFTAGVWGTLARSAIASAVMAAVLVFFYDRFAWEVGGIGLRSARLAAAIALGVAVFGAVVLALGGLEIDRLRSLLAERVAARPEKRQNGADRDR